MKQRKKIKKEKVCNLKSSESDGDISRETTCLLLSNLPILVIFLGWMVVFRNKMARQSENREISLYKNSIVYWRTIGLVWFICLMAYQHILGYLMPKPFSSKTYLTHSWEDKGVHTFPKGICPKVNVIARLEYELAYYDSAVHRFNHYTTRTPPEEQ